MCRAGELAVVEGSTHSFAWNECLCLQVLAPCFGLEVPAVS
jgi:hypothetical protein